MEIILYFFRDTISGIHYVIYAFILLFFMFSLIGYLFKQKYARVEIKLNSSQPTVAPTQVEIKKLTRKEKKALEKKKMENVQPLPKQTVASQTSTNQVVGSPVSNPNNGQPILSQPVQVAPQMKTPPVVNVVPQVQATPPQQVISPVPNTGVPREQNTSQPIPEIK